MKLGVVGGKEPCPCGSGKKYKACCYRRDLERGAAGTAAALDAAPKAAAEAAPSESQGESTEPQSDARPGGKAKVPVPAKRQALPPRKPPQGGAAKALTRRSGHR